MEAKKAKVIKMTRVEITFMNGKFIAYPGVIDESVDYTESTLTFKCTGLTRDFDNQSEILVVMSNVLYIESIKEEDHLEVIED